MMAKITEQQKAFFEDKLFEMFPFHLPQKKRYHYHLVLVLQIGLRPVYRSMIFFYYTYQNKRPNHLLRH